jgi:sugar O-acyltransferase (sialic acid O-acetyltransferase NeuD family)
MMDDSSGNIVIVGSSGHAKVVADIVERERKYRIVGLIDSFKHAGDMSFGYPILGVEDDLPAIAGSRGVAGVFIAIGDNWSRQLMAEKIKSLLPGVGFISTFHPSAQIARGVVVGKGSVCMAGAVVNSDCRIGDFCIVNTKASLDHDSSMEDYASIAPGVTTGGYVSIGAFSAVSLGASIADRRRVGRHTVIGAGSVVLHDLPDFCVAYGAPARVVRQRREGDAYV